MICSRCGAENPEGARFCNACAAPLDAEPRAAREERKVVSVVFVDLVGSTARAESSDPEDVRALLRVYHERARDELESFGGTVEKFIGDAVVAVFGAPVAHEDDPERAVRAALAVRDAVARLNEEDGDRDLHVRIAVNTGEALVSLDASPGEGEGMVAGDVVNTAARLQSAAPVDGILVGEQTYRATERQIAYGETHAIEAKGKTEPVLAYEAVEARSRLGVDLGGSGRAALVGRDEELSVLTGALGRARRERSTQLVTLVGVPGIGKSRLVYELGRVADDDPDFITWRQGRSLPYGEGVSYWALGEIVKAQAGILESDGADEVEAKLADAVTLLEDETERNWVARHLRPLLGLGADELTASDRRGEAFAAWRRYLESLAEQGPAVLVFEDLHWADDGLLDFVDGLVDWVDGVSLLVVCTARPELLERRPGWGGGKRNATTVSLAPLDDSATAALVSELLSQPVLAADTQQALIERAAGNPLYAEEFVRLVEAGDSLEGGLPDTVQGIVAARIDLLPADEKRLLQDASVLGKVFWSDALVSLAGSESWELAERLRSLERKEFVLRERRSAVAGATQFAFVHALVRDAAYGQLPRQVRADRHLAVASWIETLPEDRAEDRAETLAHHYVTAIDLRRAAGGDAGEVAPRAVAALHEAGARALALGAYGSAAGFLEQALELVGDAPPSADLLFAAGKAFGFVGRLGDELDRAAQAFAEEGSPERAAEAAMVAAWHEWHAGVNVQPRLEWASALLEGRSPSRAKAIVLAERARLAMVDFRLSTAVELARTAAALAREVGDTETEADALVTLAGSVEGPESIAIFDEAMALVGGRGRVAGRAYVNISSLWARLGDLTRSRQALEDGLAFAEREGDEQVKAFLRGNLVGALYVAGEWERALALAEQVEHDPAFVYMGLWAREAKALVLAARGHAREAYELQHTVADQARAQGDAQQLWPAVFELACRAREAGMSEGHDALMAELIEMLDAGEAVGDPQDWHVRLVLELVSFGRRDEARRLVERLPAGPWRALGDLVLRQDFVTAANRLAEMGEQPLQATLRVHAARELAAAGKLSEAAEQLEQARAFYRRVGATAYLRDADEVLSAAS